jgi:hypothetical protein
MSDENKKNHRYLGKVKSQTFNKNDGTGSFNKMTVFVDNPDPANADGTPNKYHKGVLLWCDAETGATYQVNQIDVAGVSQQDAGRGFTNSLRLDLGSEYHVKRLK